MIYEKREAGIGARREDMPIKDVRTVAAENVPKMPTQNIAYVTKQRPGFVIRARTRRKIRQGLKRAAVFFVALCLCVFVLDAKLLHGRMKAELEETLRQSVKHTLEDAMYNSEIDGNTLYTRLLYDRMDEYSAAEAESGKEYELLIETTENEQKQTMTVSGNVSQSYVDGTRYYPITSLDLSADSLYELSNGTKFSPDMVSLSKQTPTALENVEITDEPLVLIVHTHGEECYTENTKMYPEGEETRSTDTEKNVVRVGREIADTLSDYGINAIHCTTMHDSESFINAYSGSASSVKKYLKEYPSVKIVLDIHRDAIIRDDGESVKAVTNIAGQDYAQIMFVVGTNELGHNHPGWQDNLSLALSLQAKIEDTYPSLCRSINLRNVPFNQQLSSGYLLLEVGTCANTLDEALRSARAFGENLARMLVYSEN